MPNALIYTDCTDKKNGDFVAGAGVAYALQSYLNLIGSPIKCVLASSKGGVEVFKKLYKDPEAKQEDEKQENESIKVNGMSFELVELEKLKSHTGSKKMKLDYYIEVARCEPAHPELVAQILDGGNGKMLFIDLARQKTQREEQNFYVNGIRQVYESLGLKPDVLTMGLGKDRIGVTVYTGNFAKLNDEKYLGITKDSYGFLYFHEKAETPEKFIADYLKITSRLPTSPKGYIFVGDSKTSISGIEAYAMSFRETETFSAAIYDVSAKAVTSVVYDKNQLTESKTDLPKAVKLDTKGINILLLAGLPHEEMRSLVKNAIPVVGVTGVASKLEADAFGKVAFYQSILPNAVFTASHQSEIDRIFSAQPAIPKLVRLLTWEKALKKSEITTIVDSVKDDAIVGSLTTANEKLIATTQVAQAIVAQLEMIPAVAKPSAFSSAKEAVSSFASNLFSAIKDVTTQTTESEQFVEQVQFGLH